MSEVTPPARSRLVAAWIGIAVSTAGIAACITAATAGMHDVMASSVDSGRLGMCASGGPYEIAAQPCTGAQIGLLIGGILGALVFTGIQAAFTAWVDAPRLGVFAVVGGMMAAFGWNFLSLGLHTPGVEGAVTGWLICGVVFWLMAIGFLAPLALRAFEWLRRGGEPTPSAFGPGVLETALGAAAIKPPVGEVGEEAPRDGPAQAPAPRPPTGVPTRIVPPPRPPEAGR